MTKITFLLFVWGPAMVGYALGWLVRHPHDWTGPAVVGPVGLLLGLFTYRWGLKRRKDLRGDEAQVFTAGMIAGASMGVVIFGLLASDVIR
jgi:hypothetical protein